MSLSESLARLAAAPEHDAPPRRAAPPAPRGWEPGVVYAPTGDSMVVTTTATAQADADPQAWHALVEQLGVQVPDGWRVRLVEAKYDPVAWTRETPEQDKATTQPVWRYRFAVEPALSKMNVDELVKRVKRARPKPPPPDGPMAFLFAMGDTQIGKVDGDGAAGTVDRVLASVEGQKRRLKELRRAGRGVGGDVYLPWLGDCIEGFMSQGGSNAWRTPMTLTEQVRVVRRLMLHQIEEFAPLADRLIVPVIPGNHDEAVRFNGKGTTRYDDSWAVEAGIQVADALAMNPAAYGHVSVVTPGRDELTLTLDVAGTRVGFAHGHQFRPGKAHVWWAEQAHGVQPIGDATLLLSAHLHHFRMEQPGAKTWIQVPAMESESTWWRHLHGQVAPAASVSLVVGQGGWSDLALV